MLRLIRVSETCKSAARELRAGKYIAPESGEKNPEKVAMKTIRRFWLVEKAE